LVQGFSQVSEFGLQRYPLGSAEQSLVPVQRSGMVVVVEVVEVDVVDGVPPERVVVVTPWQAGQDSGTLCPTAFFRHWSASTVLTDLLLFRSQTQSTQVLDPTAVFSTKAQSVALGALPEETGWPQSPKPAIEENGETRLSAQTIAAAIVRAAR